VLTGCKDIDDALHCTSLPNGNFELGVRILESSDSHKYDCAFNLGHVNSQ